MKKIIVVLLAFIFIVSVAGAESIDYSAMTNDQIQKIIDSALHELFTRNAQEESNLLVYDQKDMQLYFTGKCTVEYDKYLVVEVIFINNTDRKLSVHADACTVNGWEVYCDIIGETSAHAKKKEGFEIRMEDADLKNISDLKELTLDLFAFDSNEFSKIPMEKIRLVYDGNSFALVK